MRKILVVLLLISVLGNAILVHRVFDLGVTTTYGADEISRRSQQVADAQKLLPLLLPATSRTDVQHAAQKAGLEILDKGEHGIFVGNILFVLSGDQVTEIKFE